MSTSSPVRNHPTGLNSATVLGLLMFGLVVLGPGCASSSRETRPAAPAASQDVILSVLDLPAAALERLERSRADSCAICAEKLRKEAFEELDLIYRPGVRVASAPEARFVRAPGGACELEIPSSAAGPRVTFRFHTAADHLVGVAEEDLTDAGIAARLQAMPEGARLAGLIEIIPFPYGDGAAFLFLPASGHLQIQCKVLEIGAE